jgi:large subunit ribosomal protein L25
MLTLKVEERKANGNKNKALRAEGKVPAVFYGPKEDSTPVSVNASDFFKVWRDAGESTVIMLDGVGDEKQALIHEVSVDPVTEEPIHVDFYIFKKGEKISVDVSLEFVGDSPAVKELGGSLVKVMHEIEVEAQPKDLPHEIEVDISSLTDFESQILVKDLKLPEGVTALAEPEDVVAIVSEPKEEEEEEEVVVEFDESMVEVEHKGKEEEGEGSDGESEKEDKSEE